MPTTSKHQAVEQGLTTLGFIGASRGDAPAVDQFARAHFPNLPIYVDATRSWSGTKDYRFVRASSGNQRCAEASPHRHIESTSKMGDRRINADHQVELADHTRRIVKISDLLGMVNDPTLGAPGLQLVGIGSTCGEMKNHKAFSTPAIEDTH